MQIETADVSLIGHREENQDRVAVAAADNAVLLVVIDGMGTVYLIGEQTANTKDSDTS